VSFVSGGLLILVGVMIFTDSVTLFTSFLERNSIGWYVGQ
jgi:cytochrome c-type biogenesis protein